jgi:hypothetical protein
MKLVVVESPYAGDVARNLRYLDAALADCFARGEAPFASHGLYTREGVLDDRVPDERARGIRAGFAWGEHAGLVAVYEDLGVTPGMLAGVERAHKRGQVVERRRLPGWDEQTRLTQVMQRADRTQWMWQRIENGLHGYDVVIFGTRYGGAYEGGEWVAWVGDPGWLDHHQSGDVACMEFWADYRDAPIGRGDSPHAAYEHLVRVAGTAKGQVAPPVDGGG